MQGVPRANCLRSFAARVGSATTRARAVAGWSKSAIAIGTGNELDNSSSKISRIADSGSAIKIRS